VIIVYNTHKDKNELINSLLYERIKMFVKKLEKEKP